MKYFFIFFCFFGSVFFSNAQTSFPDSWQGTYKGELQIFGVAAVKMKLPMELVIQKKTDSIFQWKITYDFEGKKDVRDYELLVVDASKGMYKIDEKSSIIIDAYLNQDIFTSFFEVMHNFIVATYTKKDDAIIFEIIAGKSKPISVTGNSTYKEEEIPEVKTFPVTGRQLAVLQKIN